MKSLNWLAAALMCVCAACNPSGAGDDGGKEEPKEPQIREVTGFYKGTTMCFASYMQDFGLKYREGGVETDPYVSVKKHGANIVRLQLDQVGFAAIGGVKPDWQSYARVLADARRAHAQGLDIFLTLKPDYDMFTSESTVHNLQPAAWSGRNDEQVGDLLYEWVYGTLEKLAGEGVLPAIVAVGNEVNVGFLRPDANSLNHARSGKLLAYAHRAVRDYSDKYNRKCLSALHIADPGKADYFLRQALTAGARDFDIIALSYYPGRDIGHVLPEPSMKATVEKLKADWGRAVMVIETAYSFTTGTVGGKWMGDWCDNAYNYPDWNDALNAANYTPAKQREWLLKLASEIRDSGGSGLITWGTESLPDTQAGKAEGHGTGLYTYPASWAYGSTWENNSYWDFTDGNNLHGGIDWMKDIN